MKEAHEGVDQIRGDGAHIIELLCEADGLLRDELKTQCCDNNDLGVRFLLEAQINTSRAIEALYDRALHNHSS